MVTVALLVSSKIREAWLPLIQIPPASAEASRVRFLFRSTSPLVSVIVLPERPAAKVMVAPAEAAATTARREPAPESAVFVTTSARASSGARSKRSAATRVWTWAAMGGLEGGEWRSRPGLTVPRNLGEGRPGVGLWGVSGGKVRGPAHRAQRARAGCGGEIKR